MVSPSTHRPRKLVTLVLVQDGTSVLLGMKKDGFGGGWWNGFGGKVEAGEAVEAAARRELMEEAGIDVEKLEHAGLLFFDLEGDEQLHECHVFRGSGVIGEPVETSEMITPRWFHESEIPYDQMWKGDEAWIPLFVRGARFEGILTFDAHHHLLSAAVRSV